MTQTAFASTFSDYAKWVVEEFVDADPVDVQGSFLCDVVQHFNAYFAEIFDANETDLSKSTTPAPVKVRVLFLDTWLGTHASTMSRDVMFIDNDQIL